MQIFLAALASLFNNLGTAFKVSILPFLAISGLSLAASAFFGFTNFGVALLGDFSQNALGIALLVVLGLVALLLASMAFAITAIGWHCAILENKPATFAPNLKGMPVDKYVIRMFLLALALFVISAGVAIVGAVVVMIFGSLGTVVGILGGILALGAFAFVTSVWYRMASTLPAIAVKEPNTFGDGWRQTEDLAYPIFGAAIVMLIFGFLVGLVPLVFVFSAAVSGFISLFTNWLMTMLGLSLLTEIYRRTGYTPNVTEIFE